MADFESLLTENYDGLTMQSGEICKKAVLNFIRQMKSLKDRDIIFIKKLTKVANHLRKAGELNGLEEKLYQFNMEGVEKLMANHIGLDEKCILNLKSHLFSYAGNSARAIFENTGDILWAKRRYDSYHTSAEIVRDSDLKHSAHAYSFAGESALIIFKNINEISWVEKGYQAYRNSADIFLKFNPKNSAHVFSHAGNSAELIGVQNRDKLYILRAIECYSNFLNYFETNPNSNVSLVMDKVRNNLRFVQIFLKSLSK
ncbi:MAG: hypothetical protein Q8L29_01425 [archaeon]|nr:hypothetical protein [archaeon]